MDKKSFLSTRPAAYAGAIICTSLWGTAFPLIKLGYAEFSIAQNDIGSKLLFAGERFTLAGLLVLAFMLVFNRKNLRIGKPDLLPVLSLGFVQTFLQYLFAYIGVGFTTAVNTSIITGTVSIISVVAAGLLFRSDRLTITKITGCIIGLFGIAYVNISDFSLGSVTFLGDIIVLFSAFSGAGGNIITKRIMPGRDASAVTGFQLLSGGIILLLSGFLLGGSTSFNPRGALILLWLSLVSSVSFLLWTALLKRHPVSRITIFTMLVPVFGTVWSGILLGEEIFNTQNIISLILIVIGIVLVNIEFRRKAEK